MKLFKKYKITDVIINIDRNELIRKSKILIIDDEIPTLLIEGLKKGGFNVDYVADVNMDNIHIIDTNKIDLILLDFGNVGKSLGDNEGLSILKHLKRIYPSLVILAYTSKALTAKQADFYKLTDGILHKDAGIADSMEIIEDGLRKANSLERLWPVFLSIAGIAPGSTDDAKWQNEYVRSLESKKTQNDLLKAIGKLDLPEISKKIALVVIEKLILLGFKAILPF